MQQTPPVTMVSFGMIALVLLALVVVGGIMTIQHLFGRRGLAVAFFLFVGGVGLLALMFVGVSVKSPTVTMSTSIESSHSPQKITVTPELPTTPDATPPSGPTPSKIQYITGSSAPLEIQELPGWRKNPPHEGSLGAGRAKYVLTSQQFATVEEAEAELFKSLTVDIQESLAKYHSPAVGWTPTPEDLRLSGIIAERVVETFSVKVGEFENPVHRVSWLIEFDSGKSAVLLQRWEPIEAQRRSKLMLSILAGASGLLGVAALALRRRRNQSTPETATANALT